MKELVHFKTIVLCALAGGCALETDDLADKVAPAMAEIIVTNSSSINSSSINGRVPGSEVHGGSATGTSAIGSALNGIALQGSGLMTMRASDGASLTGVALVGAVFATHMPDGSRITLRIDAHTASSSEHHTSSTVNYYALSYRPSEASEWTRVCGEQNHEPVLAIPLGGRWSYEQAVPGGGAWLDELDWITFACSGFALSKCVELGYEPWTAAGGVQLGGHHQSCVRAHRADYCGDGRSSTVDGQLINIFDELDIQDDTESWSVESRWDANGARCLSRRRIEEGVALDCTLPRCDPAPGWGNTLVATETP